MEKPKEDDFEKAANRAVKYSALVFEDLRAGVPPIEIIMAMWIALGALGVPNHMVPSNLGKQDEHNG